MREADFSDLPAVKAGRLDFIVLRQDEQEYMISGVDKIIYKNGRYYVLDWYNRKVVCYDDMGVPVFSLNKKGRGPGEYIQITDFDVTEDNELLVLDGSMDRLFEYSTDGSCIATEEMPFEANYLKYINDSTIFFSLSAWDSSQFSRFRIAVTDLYLDVKNTVLDRSRMTDPNYMLASTGFTEAGDNIVYHYPIDDYAYELDSSGVLRNVYCFDFGAGTVPDKIRTDIERYRKDLANYMTLVKSVYIGGDVIVGSMLQGDEYEDFVINRQENLIYRQKGLSSVMVQIGITGGKVIYYLKNAESYPAYIPAAIAGQVRNGNTVLAVVDIENFTD